MIKKILSLLILCSIALQSCNTYKRSFGKTFTKIETKNYNQLYRLNLSNQNLREAPQKLSQLIALRMLNISGNTGIDLIDVFKSIPNPEKLEILILDSLNLKSIPKIIQRFKNLKQVSLNFNPNINLENTISTLLPLPIEFLNIQRNNLVTLPSEISNMTALTALNLSYNSISNPEVFQLLANLPHFQSLWLTDNNIDTLPEEIGLLNSLRNLYLEHNMLSGLPDTMQKLSNLMVVHAGHNSFRQLPIQFTKMPRLLLLHINNCEISKIPKAFATTKYSLMGILLDNNKLSEEDKKQWSKEFSSFFIASFK